MVGGHAVEEVEHDAWIGQDGLWVRGGDVPWWFGTWVRVLIRSESSSTLGTVAACSTRSTHTSGLRVRPVPEPEYGSALINRGLEVSTLQPLSPTVPCAIQPT